MENNDIKVQSPIDGREMNMRFIFQFYERLEIESEDGKRVFSLIKFWYDTTENNSGLHQIYVIFAGNESKEIAVFTGLYFNPSEKVNTELLKNISKTTQLYTD